MSNPSRQLYAPLRRLRPVERGALTLLALTFSGLLVAGSIPEWMREPLGVESLTPKVRAGFYRFRAKPGLGVFKGGSPQNWSAREMCIIVVGERPDGGLERVYESYPRCRYPTFRWMADTFNLVLSARIRVGRLEGLGKSRGKPHRTRVDRLRRAPGLDGASKFFCNKHPDMDSVYLVAQTSAVHYGGKRRRRHADAIHAWSCRFGRRISADRIKVERRKQRVTIERAR